MKTTISKVITFALCFMMMATMMIVVGQRETSAAYTRYITVDYLNIRKTASSSGKVIGKYYWKDEVNCIGTNGSWTKVSTESGINGYVKTEYLSKYEPTVDYTEEYSRYVKTATTSYKTPSSASASVSSYSKGAKITCYGTSGTWTVVRKNGEEAFVRTSALSASYVSKGVTGSEVAKYALRFVGNPYVYGGTSLTRGTDCSGFTMSVYKHFGYKLPRTSGEQRSAGKGVSYSQKKPGDLICYYGHVALYIGNNTVVHASSRKTGIKTTSPANYRSVAAVRRIIR